MRRRFPLGDTSTVYMDGTGCYQLVSLDRPGVIATVVMRPDRAEMYRESIGRAMADAWDEGHNAGCGDPYKRYGECDCGPNPYRSERGEK